MMRLLIVLVVLLMVGVVMPGCEQQASDDAAARFGVEEGTRSKDGPKRAPPGPPDGDGFQASGETDEEPLDDDEGEDDSDD